ncbi:MAG: hypothetical protein IAF02_28295, partial [Anaerolineae bacterium]|nr:hypothetical protein [Anaerolineae bacterium]
TYEIAAREMAADESLLVQSNWRAPEPVAGEFRETVRLIGPDGLLWSPKTAVSPRWYREPTPTNTWTRDQYADSQLLIEPIPGTPPGLYTIQMLLFDEETLIPVPLTTGETAIDLGTVQVTRPKEAATSTGSVGVLEPQYPLNQNWNSVTLSGVSLDREAAAPGDPFLLSLYWQVDEAPLADADVQLSLINEQGEAVFTRDLPPVRADFPTSQWQAGDAWLGQHAFRLPVALASGDYVWTLKWRLAEALAQDVVLGRLAITAPERLFTPPAVDVETDAQLGELATLLGVNLTIEPDTLQTTLVWQAAAEPPISYRVFVHLIDEDGQIVAQSDGEPAAWTRPTTGWLPGEIILDTHTLSLANLPSGSYQLAIGLYDPYTGNRLTLANGETAVIIPELTLP